MRKFRARLPFPCLGLLAVFFLLALSAAPSSASAPDRERLVAGASGAPAAQASRTKYKLKRCGTIATTTEGVSAREKVLARGVSCDFARRVLRASNVGKRIPRGWVCTGSGEGAWCAASSSAASEVAGDEAVRPYRRYVQGDLTV
ncbi:MAG: hypothetical protein ACSLFR_17810 [Solirubrobacteraceae bacterium]